MALTYTQVAKGGGGNFRMRIVVVLAEATKNTSGYTLTAADFQQLVGGPGNVTTTASLSNLVSFDAEVNVGGVTATIDRTNSKMLFWEAGAQSTTTISSKTVRLNITHNMSNFK